MLTVVELPEFAKVFASCDGRFKGKENEAGCG